MRLFSLVNGESVEVRKIFKRLDWYKRLLLQEIGLLKRSNARFAERSKTLIRQFESQEQQIRMWGLSNTVLKAFRMQAWARVSRSFVIEDLSSVAVEVLQARLTRANNVIAQFQTDKSAKEPKHSLESYDQVREPTMRRGFDQAPHSVY